MATADTIAVKCPGCQAGFDVPTSLAGKTIRCTSCKTQLPVPAGRAAAAPLPTARPARPSNGPPGKSAAELLPRGGKPNRPRDDDDEDDDDEDDRPARRSSGKKKKAASGGSAMPLILAGVAVLLLGGGGLGAFLYFKKDAPAAASSNSSSNSTTTPAGGTKNGPPAGMTPPAGDGAAPAADGWKVHQGDGFTVEFPDVRVETKSQPNPLTGASMSMVGAERPGKDGIFAVVIQELPAAAKKLDPREYLRQELNATTNGLFGALGGPKFNVVKKDETTVDGHPGAEIELTEGQKRLTMRLAVAHGRMFMAMAGDEGKPGQAEETRRFLASLKITSPGSGGENVAANTPQDGGRGGPPPGMFVPMPTPGGPPPGMFIPMPTMPNPGGPPPGMFVPMPNPGGPPPGPGSPPPGMFVPMPTMPNPGGPPPGPAAQPGPPPGPGIQPGPPPGAFNPGGGTPGFGGSSGGGYTTPPLATQVDPFFTIAFDADKSEVFTVSVQVTAGKASYKLNRYTYPAFIHKGDWKLPALAVRSALDTANGKLYLATAPLTQTLYTQQKGDRNAGAGDIAVYDLAGIRDGKVKERSDLKPAATIAAGGKVFGLDVSPDGKVLTVLAARPAGKGGKAALRQYDTADRKLLKEKELPNAAWDLTRAGDKLLVLEDPRSSAGQSLLVCDAATLEPQTLRLPAVTTDVAPGPDGKLLAASGATAGSSGDLALIDPGAPPKKLTTTAARKHQNGYARFTPDGKKLLVASHGLDPQNASLGLDVYDVGDPADPNSYKRVATVRSSGLLYVGGYFHISPDGERVVIQSSGAVIETARLAEHLVGPEPPGLNGSGGPGPMGPGGMPMPGAAPFGMPMPPGMPMPGVAMPPGMPMPGAMPPPGGERPGPGAPPPPMVEGGRPGVPRR